MARRPARLVALLAGVVALAAGASACSTISELLELEERIEREGYRVEEVFHDDFGTRNEVQVDARTNRGRPPPEGLEHIAGVVWETYPRRFESVLVTLDDDSVTFTRVQLEDRFGPRVSRLDEQAFSDDVSGTIRTAAIAGLVGLVAVVGGAIAIVIAVRRRRRRRGPPPPGVPPGHGGHGGHGTGPGPGWGPPPPPPGPPPGWAPTPGTGSGYPPPSSR